MTLYALYSVLIFVHHNNAFETSSTACSLARCRARHTDESVAAQNGVVTHRTTAQHFNEIFISFDQTITFFETFFNCSAPAEMPCLKSLRAFDSAGVLSELPLLPSLPENMLRQFWRQLQRQQHRHVRHSNRHFNE